MKNSSQHERFAQESQGISDDSIYNKIFEVLNREEMKGKHILDIGCGEGQLLEKIKAKYHDTTLYGVDLIQYKENNSFTLIKQNLNEDFSLKIEPVDIIIATEVIEHLENPRHFLRQLKENLKVGGVLIITTPNTISYLSLLSYFIKGYHSSFGPKDYPAHITPLAPFDINNIINETEHLEVEAIEFIANGRIPGSSMRYTSLLPFLKGKRFSDNYCCIIKRN